MSIANPDHAEYGDSPEKNMSGNIKCDGAAVSAPEISSTTDILYFPSRALLWETPPAP